MKNREEEKILFADVILALHLPYSYTYRVPDNLRDSIAVGQRVAVQLRNRIYSAVVIATEYATLESKRKNTGMQSPAANIKYILDIIDIQPIVTPQQILFFKWVADYYAAYIGDVLTAAMPASFRLKSETTVSVSPYFNADVSSLDDNELRIFNIVAKKEKISLEEIESISKSTSLAIKPQSDIKTIHNLIKKDVLITDEELYSRYKPKQETFISLNDKFSDKNELKLLLDSLDKRKNTRAQCEVILQYLALFKTNGVCRKTDLEQSGCSPHTVETLLKKDIFVKQSFEISRLKEARKTQDVASIVLNDQQQYVFDQITAHWNEIPVSLIHGVTGSGKTEIYIKLIDKVINEGGQVLYLLPEIAITSQLIKRLEKYFGSTAVAYNSKFSTVERAEIWRRVMIESDNTSLTTDNNDIQSEIKPFDIVIGSRSAVFLPFTNLKLVIIDEEHDTAFKQNEPVPHYNGRDSALYLAKMFNAKTVLGSATPNIETYKLACENKYQLLELNKQYFDLPLPETELVDMKQAIREKKMYGIFSERLFDEINNALQDNKQVIIFQNRRGYAPHIECNVCGYVPKCPNCDVSLVLHKERTDLECHYCGYHTDTVSYCPQCQSHSMRFVGTGTEKIEEELQTYFPKARIQRMDLDSTRTKDAYTKIIDDFAARKTDILCGTQIIAKGLDFENVSLVGVLGADIMLHYPDFRAFERTFQILTQVSGRAGRKNGIGKVLIQTFEPNHPIMQDVVDRNYLHMYQMQLKERQIMNFPPYCRLIKITLQHRDNDFVIKKSNEYALNLRKIFGGRIFGPQQPVIARIKNLYAMEIWIKIEKNIPYSSAKQHLREYNEEFLSQRANSQIRISIYVDPV